jgi:hypothetical protein
LIDYMSTSANSGTRRACAAASPRPRRRPAAAPSRPTATPTEAAPTESAPAAAAASAATPASPAPEPALFEAEPAPAPPAPEALSKLQIAILDFERNWWQFAGSKETAIADQLGLSPTRYYQLLVHALDHPDAVKHNPVLVHRLDRLRRARSAARTSHDRWAAS